MPVPFVLSFTASQSADGRTVTITDTSPWGVGVNNENYVQSTFVRSLELTNYLDVSVITIPLPTGTNSVTYSIPAKTNPWININYTATGIVDLGKVQRYPFNRIFQLAYIDAVKGGCGCGCTGDNELCEVDAFATVSDYAEPVGDAVGYQINIDAAYKLLS